MKDYELTLKVRNAPLLNMMRNHEYDTAAALSRATGVSQGKIGQLLALKRPMCNKDGSISGIVQKLSDHFGCSPVELFPENHWFEALPENTFVAQVDAEHMHKLTSSALSDPVAFLEYIEQPEIDELVEMLSDREAKVIKMRFEEDKPLNEVGAAFGVSPERVRQIEGKALRKLRRRFGGDHRQDYGDDLTPFGH